MKTLIAILLVIPLRAGNPPQVAPPILKTFLESKSVEKTTSQSLEYRVEFKSFNQGKTKEVFKDSGNFVVGMIRKEPWVGALSGAKEPPIGEPTPLAEGLVWFKQFCEPSRLMPFTGPVTFLDQITRNLRFKRIEALPKGEAEVGDMVLVYQLEAPKPTVKFWKFKVQTDEAKLQIHKDGSPVRLEVSQSYEGNLSPHFGTYSLNRKEVWTFTIENGQVITQHYRLTLHRQDWKKAMKVDVELAPRKVEEEKP